MADASEQVRLECHCHGGSKTIHTLIRPVARVTALSTYAALLARAAHLQRTENDCAAIAAILNQEAWRPPQRRDTFNAAMVRRLLSTAGVIAPGQRRPRTITAQQPDEWTIRELAEELDVPQPTSYRWVQTGRLPRRSAKAVAGLQRWSPPTLPRLPT